MTTANTVCSLSVYISHKHSDFNELLKNVCCNKLTSLSSRSGLAFIIPDSKLVKKYLKISEDLMQNDELQEIRDFCRKHFLFGDLENESTKTAGNINNDNLNVSKTNKGVMLKGSEKGEVNLTKLNINFSPNTLREQEFKSIINVYKQDNSENGIHTLKWIKIDKPKREPYNPNNKHKHNKTVSGGGFRNLINSESMVRYIYTQNLKYIMNQKKTNVINDKVLDDFRNPYLAVVNSLFLFLQFKYKNYFDCLLLLKDVSPEVNFYMFVEPFNKTNNRLIPIYDIYEWECTLFEYYPHTFNSLLDITSNSNINSNHKLRDIVSNLNENTYSKLSDFFKENKVDKISNEYIQWCDLFRFIYRKKFIDALRSPDPGVALQKVVDHILTYNSGVDKSISKIVGNLSKDNYASINKKMLKNGSINYINNLVVYDYSIDKIIKVNDTKELLQYHTKDVDNFDYMIDGYNLVNNYISKELNLKNNNSYGDNLHTGVYGSWYD